MSKQKRKILRQGHKPALIGLGVAVSYKWKHNTFLSILLGTVCYMVFLRIFWFAHKKWLKIRGCNHRLTNCPCGFLVCNGENSYDNNIKYAMRMAGGGAYDISG